MKKILFVSIFFLLINCSKPKAVFICGDHVCINNAEANQYFEENMTIQVQIIDKKKDSEFDLVELNLRHNKDNRKEVTFSKSLTKKAPNTAPIRVPLPPTATQITISIEKGGSKY